MCFVASIGITGGLSAAEVTFLPVRGTSAGTVGWNDVECAVVAGVGDFGGDFFVCDVDAEDDGAVDVAGVPDATADSDAIVAAG